MKRTFIYSAGAGIAVSLFLGMLSSCSGNKKAENETTDQDSLKAMEELVQTVIKPLPEYVNPNYNASFFTDATKKGETASDSTYIETPTGLKYVMVQDGSGVNPGPTDVVTVQYIGNLENGVQFDSSVDRGEPASFPLNQVIPGWTEGLQYMKPGGVAVFYIPSELAYGERDLGIIPANSPLIFWVQLLDINK